MQLLSFGSAFTLNQNEGYGLPVKPAFLTASAAVEVSLDGVTWLPLAGADTGVIVGTRAIRSTLAGTIVMLKEAVFSTLPPTGGGGGGGGTLPTDAIELTDHLSLGVNPALTGALRLANNVAIRARNGANTGDVDIIQVGVDDSLNIGYGIHPPGYINTAGRFFFNGEIISRDTITFAEMTAPAAPGVNQARLFLQDNGSGKSQLMILFNTGAIVPLATEGSSGGGGTLPTDALGKVLISQGAGVPAISNNVKLTGAGTGVKLTPGTRDYNIVPNDAAGQIEYSLSDRISLLAFQITDTGVAVRAGQVGGAVLPSALLLKSTQAPLTITTAEAGGSQPVYIGKRDTDGSPAVGCNVEIWPATGQAAPPLAVMAPGGASRVFSVALNGAVDSPSITAQFGLVASEGACAANEFWFNTTYLVSQNPNGAQANQFVVFRDLVSDTPGATAVGGGTKKGLAISDGTKWLVIASFVAPVARSIQYVIDGNGSVLTTGLKGYLEVPYACTILSATLLADVSGSVVVDIWKDTYANYPPVVADTITASAKPTISAALKAQDSTLTGWNKTVAAGDILAFNIDSVTSIKRLSISLKVQPA
jgi:hypothetical protein